MNVSGTGTNKISKSKNINLSFDEKGRKGSFWFILVSIIILLVVIVIIPLATAFTRIKTIRKNWPEYRCKPNIMPIAGLIGPKGTSTNKNFSECMSSILNETIDKKNQPQNLAIGGLTGIVSGITDDIQNMRKFFYNLRTSISETIRNIVTKLYNTYKRLAFLFKSFIRVFVRLLLVFKNLFNVLRYSFYTIGSIWNGPVGGAARGIGRVANFFCFGGETLVHIKGKGIIPMRSDKIELGDILVGSGSVGSRKTSRIIGICKFKYNGEPMYKYNGVNVSGSHYVYKDGKIMLIEDIDGLERVEYMGDSLYCYITDSSFIPIGGDIYTDFMVTHDYDIFERFIRETDIIKSGNMNIVRPDYKLKEDITNAHGGFLCLSKEDENKIINNNNDNFVGYIRFLSKRRTVYRYNDGYNDVYLLENTFIRDIDRDRDSEWLNINCVVGCEKIYIEEEREYINFITNGSIHYSNIDILDFGYADCDENREKEEIIIKDAVDGNGNGNVDGVVEVCVM